MKKFVALVCLVAAGVLVGCGGEKKKAPATNPNAVTDKMKETSNASKKAEEVAKEGGGEKKE